jgi:ABC-type transport system involved in cytochrome bd biosynthesis fused ATPase/permease subunit
MTEQTPTVGQSLYKITDHSVDLFLIILKNELRLSKTALKQLEGQRSLMRSHLFQAVQEAASVGSANMKAEYEQKWKEREQAMQKDREGLAAEVRYWRDAAICLAGDLEGVAESYAMTLRNSLRMGREPEET